MLKQLLGTDSWLINLFSRITDIFILQILFLISSLPLFTIGAAVSSSLAVAMELARGNNDSILRSYHHHFCVNFKQATLSYIFLLTSLGLVMLDLYFINFVTGFFKVLLNIAVIIFGIIISLFAVYGFGYLSRYKVGIKQLGLNCLYLAIRYPSSTICLVFLNGLISLSVLSSPIGLLTGVYFFSFGGFGLLAILNGWGLNKIFSRLEKDNLVQVEHS